MQKLYLLLCLLVISLSVFAQQDTHIETPEEAFKKSLEQEPPSFIVVDEDVIVLDSTLSYAYIAPIDGGISNKRIYEYNEDALRTFYQFHFFDYNALTLFRASEFFYENYPDSIWQTSFYQASATDTLTPGDRGYDLYNNDVFTGSYREIWDLEDQEWVNSYRNILLEETDEYRLTEYSVWVDSLNDYVVNSRNESIFSGDTTTVTTLFPNPTTGELEPVYRYTSALTEGLSNYFDSQTYIDEEWVTTYRYSYQVDQTALTAYSYTWGTWVTGSLDFIDSIAYELDENFRTLESRTYQYIDDAFSTDFISRLVNTYSDLGSIETSSYYDANNMLSFETQYFYSTITVVDTDEPLEDFGIKLQYPNPATSSDQVQIIANGDILGEQYHAQLYSQNGQLLSQQKVQAGDQIELNQLTTNGMFYIVLTDGAKRHAWKLMMAN